jgi:hypothetical protein
VARSVQLALGMVTGVAAIGAYLIEFESGPYVWVLATIGIVAGVAAVVDALMPSLPGLLLLWPATLMLWVGTVLIIFSAGQPFVVVALLSLLAAAWATVAHARSR